LSKRTSIGSAGIIAIVTSDGGVLFLRVANVRQPDREDLVADSDTGVRGVPDEPLVEERRERNLPLSPRTRPAGPANRGEIHVVLARGRIRQSQPAVAPREQIDHRSGPGRVEADDEVVAVADAVPGSDEVEVHLARTSAARTLTKYATPVKLNPSGVSKLRPDDGAQELTRYEHRRYSGSGSARRTSRAASASSP
jgi:hypothetical protein